MSITTANILGRPIYIAEVPRKNASNFFTRNAYENEHDEILAWVKENTTTAVFEDRIPHAILVLEERIDGERVTRKVWRKEFYTEADAMLFFLRWGGE